MMATILNNHTTTPSFAHWMVSLRLLILAVASGVGVLTSIHVSFSDDQTELFAEMVEKASEATRQEPADVKGAIEFLECVHNY